MKRWMALLLIISPAAHDQISDDAAQRLARPAVVYAAASAAMSQLLSAEDELSDELFEQAWQYLTAISYLNMDSIISGDGSRVSRDRFEFLRDGLLPDTTNWPEGNRIAWFNVLALIAISCDWEADLESQDEG